MQRLVICLAVLACLLHTSAAFDWQPCSDSSKTADINKVSLTPEEPAAGDTVKFLVDGTAKVDVSAGTIDIAVMYSGLPIYSETRDLCDMATCPIKTGPLQIDFDQYLPPIVPPGPYNVTLDAKAANGAELLCLQVLFDVTMPSVAATAAASALEHKAANMFRGRQSQA